MVHAFKIDRQMKRINLKKFLTEPLLQFLVMGCMLYIFVSFIQHQKEKLSREIVVDGERVALLVSNYKTQTGELPSRDQLNAMIDNYIKEEIFFREAKKMGLDKDDEIIRRRLSQKFDFVRSDLKQISAPSDQQLRQFYNTHRALFETEGSVNFSHIFFSTDRSSDSAAKLRALTVLRQLDGTSVQRAPEKGDRFPLQYDYADQAALDIRETFGDKPIVDSLFKSSVGHWSGPVQSGYGWHLVYISRRSANSQMLYQPNKDFIKQKYMDVTREKENENTFDLLAKTYIIKRTYLSRQ
jgi:peptidyl-prolyl cis-trans isomerase C